MSSGKTNLYDLADTLKTAVAAAFVAGGVSLPSRQYVTTGTPVGDCDSFVVSWNRVFFGTPANEQDPGFVYASAAVTRSVVLSLTIFRCIKTLDEDGATPTTTEMANDARTVMTDAYTLHKVVAALKAAGTFRGICESIALGPCTALEPEGGMAGCTMSISAELS